MGQVNRWRRPPRRVSIDEAFYGANLGDVVQSRFAVASNLLGATGTADIRELQSALNSLASSLPPLVVDGLVGPKTRERVAEYQRQVGLNVNGDPYDAAMRAALPHVVSGIATTPVRSSDYYVRGTPFLWLVPVVEVGFGLSIDPFEDARNKLASFLNTNGYNARVVALRGGALEVSGSQNIDRASKLNIRDQITAFARAAGFLWSMPVQFNVESAGSSFRVGSSGATQTYGDRTPVPVKDALTEFGVNPFASDPSGKRNIPNLSGGTGTIIIVVLAGLVVAKVLRR